MQMGGAGISSPSYPSSPTAVTGAGFGWAEGGEGGESGDSIDLVLCIGADEKLLSRLNELHNAETVTTSGKGSDAKWRLDVKEVVGALWRFVKGE